MFLSSCGLLPFCLLLIPVLMWLGLADSSSFNITEFNFIALIRENSSRLQLNKTFLPSPRVHKWYYCPALHFNMPILGILLFPYVCSTVKNRYKLYSGCRHISPKERSVYASVFSTHWLPWGLFITEIRFKNLTVDNKDLFRNHAS